MAEILTESFCERCGSRYTFEATSGRRPGLGPIRTLSRGVKNFVANDDASFSDAMAAAREDDARKASLQQLDAFHKTFNFCLTCRQYTCRNCWNGPAGECLSCAPDLSREVLPAPFPDLALVGRGVDAVEEPVASPANVAASAWPTTDVRIVAPEPPDAGDLVPTPAIDDEAALPELTALDATSADSSGVELTSAELAAIEGALSRQINRFDARAAAAAAPHQEPAFVEPEPVSVAAVGGVAEIADAAIKPAQVAEVEAAAEVAEGAEVEAAAAGLPPPVALNEIAQPAVAPTPDVAESAGKPEPLAEGRAQTRSFFQRFRSRASRPTAKPATGSPAVVAAVAPSFEKPAGPAIGGEPVEAALAAPAPGAIAVEPATEVVATAAEPAPTPEAVAAEIAMPTAPEPTALEPVEIEIAAAAPEPALADQEIVTEPVPTEPELAAAAAAEPEPEPVEVATPTAPEPAPQSVEIEIAAAAPEPALADQEIVAEPAPTEPEVGAAAAAEPAPEPVEAEVAAAEPAPEPVEAEVAPAEPAPEPVEAEVAAAEPAPEPVEPVEFEIAAAAAEPALADQGVDAEPVAVDAELAAAAAAEPAPEPVQAEAEVAAATPPTEPAPAPALAPPPTDVAEQPTWRMVAPDGTAPGETEPATPIWATPASVTRRPTDAMPTASWASRVATARPVESPVWAASSRDILAAAPTGAAAPVGIHSCVSCGLSLSANARFCRRCGTRQG